MLNIYKSDWIGSNISFVVSHLWQGCGQWGRTSPCLRPLPWLPAELVPLSGTRPPNRHFRTFHLNENFIFRNKWISLKKRIRLKLFLFRNDLRQASVSFKKWIVLKSGKPSWTQMLQATTEYGFGVKPFNFCCGCNYSSSIWCWRGVVSDKQR